MKLSSLLAIFFAIFISSFNSQSQNVRVEPPFWWTNMHDSNLQLLVYAKNISQYAVDINYEAVKIKSIDTANNKNYLFINLIISSKAQPGTLNIRFSLKNKPALNYNYQLLKRENGSAERIGYRNNDIIYLLMPDRFANGNPTNDNIQGMPDNMDRKNPNARHGGDIAGINKNINYFKELGITTVWINPLLENNMKSYSYHGYAITDFYKTDPRFGNNTDYINLVKSLHNNNIKVIMDMVFNHCGSENWLIKELPFNDWVHKFPNYTSSNFRAEALMDKYTSESDKNTLSNGWFDKTMPDLNQQNPYLAKYLIQNSVWWIEYAAIDGIRMDTYPYSDQNFMTDWMKRINLEYPNFSILKETWLQTEPQTSWFENKLFANNKDISLFSSITDFPLYYALNEAFKEKDDWTKGLNRIYYVLSKDFLYSNPQNNVIFLDNHDLNRFYTSQNKNIALWKMGITLLLTSRGIPAIYYGTEILFDGVKESGDGNIRKDFPGGWEIDSINAFTKSGLSTDQKEAFNYLKRLIEIRKEFPALSNGKLLHFIPSDEVYTYFRYDEKDKIMILINNSDSEKKVDLNRFHEAIYGYTNATNLFDHTIINLSGNIQIKSKSAIILKLFYP